MERIVNHYTKCLEENRGNKLLEVDWSKDPAVARSRYRAMWQQLEEDNYSAIRTVLDFGCGTGTALDYTNKSFIYTGVDASDAMIEEAEKRYPLQKFIHKPLNEKLTGSFDYTICNGVFTEKRDYTQQEMYAYFFSELQMLLDVTRIGLTFNVMNWYSLPPDSHREELFFLDFNAMARALRDLGVPKYSFSTDYGCSYEYCVRVKK